MIYFKDIAFFNLNLAFFLTLIQGRAPLFNRCLKILLSSQVPSANTLSIAVIISDFAISSTNSGNAVLSS
jgi:hypothetical protein